MEAVDIERLVGEMEIVVDRLRSLYEQYFMGIEKLEPTVVRKDLERRIQVLRKEQIRNTAQRFRFQMILQRYNTYQTHWQRVCREIENGTYKRHVQRANQKFGGGQAAAKPKSFRPPPPQALSKELADELADLDREFAPAGASDDLDVDWVEAPTAAAKPSAPSPPAAPARPPPAPPARQAPPPAPAARAAQPPAPPPPRPQAAPPPPPGAPQRPPPPPLSRPATPAAIPAKAAPAAPPRPPPAPPAASPPRPPPARPSGDLPEERIRQIYAQYVDTKRKQNESTAGITFEAIARTVRDSSAKLREKHGKAVDFEVAVKDGKAVLKPVLK